MANFEIDEEVLVAFLKGELDAAQAAAVEAWYDRSAANRRMLGQVYYILYVSDRINDAAGIDVERSLRQFKRRMHAGRRISLRRIAVRAAAAAAVAVILLAGGVTTVSLSKRLAQPLTVITHLGERSQVVLPDGTKVWLNSKSRLEYPSSFGRRSRRVTLCGEGYFEVAHDERKPFVVETGQYDVRVLGTTFNVHAYSEDEDYQITLATGSLLVDGGRESRSVRLRPGEQGFFERTSGMLSLRRVNVDHVLSWQEDKLYFRAEPLASIARTLERQFNVDIVIADERLRKICFTGEFVDGENIHEIMRIISADSRILYRNRKNRFELYRNR